MAFQHNTWIRSEVIDAIQNSLPELTPNKTETPRLPVTTVKPIAVTVEKPVKMVDMLPKPARGAKRTFKDQDDFWKFINDLNWRDQSESTIGMVSIVPTKMAGVQKDSFLQYGEPLVVEIMAKIGPYCPEKIVRKVSWHILAKGKEFYSAIRNSPDLCAYLLPNDESEGDYVDFEALVKTLA